MVVQEHEYRVSVEPPIEEANLERWDAATKAFLEQVESFLPGLRASDLEAMTKAISEVCHAPVSSNSESALALRLTGRQYTQQESLRLEIVSLLRYFERRRELLQNSFTAKQVGELLGTTRQTPHDRAEKGSLLAVLDKGIWRFPSWQFDPQGPDGVVEGLPEVLKALGGSNFSKLNWLVCPNHYLDDLAPIEALKRGYKERVLKEAEAVGVW